MILEEEKIGEVKLLEQNIIFNFVNNLI